MNATLENFTQNYIDTHEPLWERGRELLDLSTYNNMAALLTAADLLTQTALAILDGDLPQSTETRLYVSLAAEKLREYPLSVYAHEGLSVLS